MENSSLQMLSLGLLPSRIVWVGYVLLGSVRLCHTLDTIWTAENQYASALELFCTDFCSRLL